MKKILSLLLIFFLFLILVLSAIYGIFFGISIVGGFSHPPLYELSFLCLFLGTLGASGIAKMKEKISFSYLFLIFPIGSVIGGIMGLFLAPHNIGAMFLIIAFTFLIFFLVGTFLNRKFNRLK